MRITTRIIDDDVVIHGLGYMTERRTYFDGFDKPAEIRYAFIRFSDIVWC